VRVFSGQRVVVQRVQHRVGFLGGGRIRRQNILCDRPFKNLANAIPELCRSHARFDVPHGMIHVDKDGSDTVPVCLNICLSAVSAVGNIEGKDLVFQMYDTTGCVSRIFLRLSPFSVSRPVLRLHHGVGCLTSSWRCFRFDHCFREYLDVSPDTTPQSLRNLPVKILYTAEFSAAGGLSEELVDPVPDEAPHSSFEHSPLSTVSLEFVTSGQSTEKVGVDPSLYPAEPVYTVLVESEELVL